MKKISLNRKLEAMILNDGVKKDENTYIIRCPFHSECTPSSIVDTHKDSFECLSCGKKCTASELCYFLQGRNVGYAVRKIDGEEFSGAERLQNLQAAIYKFIEIIGDIYND